LSELVSADFEDLEGNIRRLEIPEMISIVQQLMVAGNEATTKGITEIMKLLVENPDEWKRMRDDPTVIPAIAEEGLRLASPNQGLFRLCTEDAEVAGTKIAKGQMLWVMFGSANRDEAVFPDPDRFDPSRKNLSDTLAFGRGAHFCIGAQLARLEIRVLFEELAKRIESPRFAPGTTLEYEPSFILRGLKELEIEFD
jgi:cytochrome P450